ncbi:MAG: sulfatase-like hydrolase/transferase, partial [Myxococcota bacterium]
ASLLSGISPDAHHLIDTGAMLSASVETLGAMAKNRSVRAAFFTSVPNTFEFFGFGAQWERFTPYPPNSGASVIQPLIDAFGFVSSAAEPDERPTFALVHLRGGHPPWEVTPDEARDLPPDDYSGAITPRRSAQQLAAAQGRFSRFSEADRERMDAMFYVSLAKQDSALRGVIDSLDEAGLYHQTLFVVTADVGSARSTLFRDGLPLDPDRLALPLYVHFPEGRFAGERVVEPTEMVDVTATVVEALELQPSRTLEGISLHRTASGSRSGQRIRVAYLDQTFFAQWGEFAIYGERGERPHLCQLALDPLCRVDRRHLFPHTAQALNWRLSAYLDGQKNTRYERMPLRLSSDAAAILKVWGIY